MKTVVNITNTEISVLMLEADMHRDADMSDICQAALWGSEEARLDCCHILNDRIAQDEATNFDKYAWEE